MQCPVCSAEQGDATSSCHVCGTDLSTLAPGTVIADRYDIRGLLGRGGMGSVYRAFDRVLDEEVALKVQLAEAARDPDAERRFRTEVKLARQVSHPNVCRLHDGGQQGTSRWISMELVDGETLGHRIRRTPLDETQARELALQAAEGLAAVHRAGIVHRDLKSANLMVDRSGRLRLMDFGIARPAAAGEPATGGYAQGSPEYMSPEQARGHVADARSDVYALGVVAFELLTGDVPFRAETPVATLLQHLERAPPLERLPASLRPIVAKALAKRPEERFASGAEMAAALRAARADGSRPASAHPRSRRALVLVAAALTVAAALVALRSFRTETPDSPARPGPSAPPSPSSPPAEGPSRPSPSPPATTTPPQRPAAVPSLHSPAGPPAAEPTRAAEPEAEEALAPAPPPAPPPTTERTEAPVAVRETPDGALLVVVRPWADVSVDGVPRGQTPLARFPLPPGPHQVLLTHPDYRPYPRRVVILPGETLRLTVDLRTDGVRRR